MPTPAAEVDVDLPLVRALLRDQHPDLAVLPLEIAANGWDNVIVRLGDVLAVRLPRRAAAAELIEHEQRWLPEIAHRVAAIVPVPDPCGPVARRSGSPGRGASSAGCPAPRPANAPAASASPRRSPRSSVSCTCPHRRTRR
ncbi:hypothetical protein P9139_02335 [Curtobacterium flaccumfaciens]|nr:hypothetical protein P9139_02335 [Curtobacterium flaccumfaciens]